MSPGVPPPEWEAFIARNPQAHLLQTAAWGELKARFGWSVERVCVGNTGAQILFRSLPLGLTLAYIPRGPIGDWLSPLLPKLDAACKAHRAFVLKVEPDDTSHGRLAEMLAAGGFRPSPHTVQPRRTLIVDLQGDEDQILARMHQKTRYNIRLALRKEVRVRPWEDLQTFHGLMRQTAARDDFAAHSAEYYAAAYALFKPREMVELFVDELDGETLLGFKVFAHAPRLPLQKIGRHAVTFAVGRGAIQIPGAPAVGEDHQRRQRFAIQLGYKELDHLSRLEEGVRRGIVLG